VEASLTVADEARRRLDALLAEALAPAEDVVPIAPKRVAAAG
jgi:hypothetical protein